MGATQSVEKPYILETTKGNLKGLQQFDEGGRPILCRYTSIPFARAPVDKLRWRRPQKLPSDFSFSFKSGEPGDYTTFGPICPQPVYNHSAAAIDNPNAAPEVENTQSEDCLYLNIWVPAGSPPSDGWPVQFHIHGGWLQVGDANQSNDHDPYSLLAHSTPRIIVSPTYRLNLFGFLAGSDLAFETSDPAAGNYGLWDQRCALEWTHKNISLFGGNAGNITVGGLSAGSHSAFLQLYHDISLPLSERIIKSVYLWSNAIAIQPNATASEILSTQFDSLCNALDITTSQSAASKLSALRSVPSADLVSAISKLSYHTFRACTDESFIPSTFLESLHNGTFTTKVAEAGVRIMLGEVCDEALLYKLVNPPTDRKDLVTQLKNYYPQPVVDKLLTLGHLYKIPSESTVEPDDAEAYADVFARLVADLQVHVSLRGLTHILLNPPSGGKAVPPRNLFRYRISWRAPCLDEWIEPSVGVCHAADTPIWWGSGYRAGYTSEDRGKSEAFLKPFGQFLYGKDVVQWGQSGDERTLRYLDEYGKIHEDWNDALWDKALEVWNAIWAAQKTQ